MPTIATTARKTLAHKVRLLRFLRGWSQEVLAETSGLHRTYISSIEGASAISAWIISRNWRWASALLLLNCSTAIRAKTGYEEGYFLLGRTCIVVLFMIPEKP
ncbi:MAG TPA: helix-turn-helix transcriptional regulator [Acidiferrobacterales bacterium]|nr:helix-turn-helix transcriptional regulator [Acidiferrobacterales bacterium]